MPEPEEKRKRENTNHRKRVHHIVVRSTGPLLFVQQRAVLLGALGGEKVVEKVALGDLRYE